MLEQKTQDIDIDIVGLKRLLPKKIAKRQRVDEPTRRPVDAPTRPRVDESTHWRVDAWTRPRQRQMHYRL